VLALAYSFERRYHFLIKLESTVSQCVCCINLLDLHAIHYDLSFCFILTRRGRQNFDGTSSATNREHRIDTSFNNIIMKAAVRTGILGWTISFKTDHPKPSHDTLKPNEVLLQVKSAAINPIDYKLPRLIGGKVVGIDVSGIVEEVGENVTAFQKGDHVFGRAINGKGAFSGSLAEWSVASMNEIAKKPDYLQFDEAAAMPTAYLTGMNSLRDAGKMKEGSTVLIIGASGGCGLAGCQIAKGLGAGRIVGVCSGKSMEFVRTNAGIDELIDYTDKEAMHKFS
jgi:D-arabinose 1-dehydrogenase-like Zn-dependent alcohol dehydrogenase